MQPAWGPGRVDTFNPYKVIQFGVDRVDADAGRADRRRRLPAVFEQRPRRRHEPALGRQQCRRLPSAICRPRSAPASRRETVDHDAIERVADWLGDLKPPAEPAPAGPGGGRRGQGRLSWLPARDCHGYQDGDGYVFEGERLGKVEPIAGLGTDPARLDSYTEAFRARQLERAVRGNAVRVQALQKTDGYANLPLDGLWLRGPYLHNGSVPTLADLLQAAGTSGPRRSSAAWTCSIRQGGFAAPDCDPAQPPANGYCFDTTLPGNGSGGHAYGVDLARGRKGRPAGIPADVLSGVAT